MRKIIDDNGSVNKGGKGHRVQRLAARLLADRERCKPQSNSTRCHLCGRSYTYVGPNGDDSGRFCCPEHRQQYDDGKRAATYSRRQQFQMRMGKVGFWITCPCGRTFESKGWKFCSLACQRQAHQQAETAATLAEVGMEAPAKRRCAVAGCSRPVPRWRRGRKVSSAAKYCDVHTRSRKKGERPDG
jgi:hypothetical protein